MAEDFRQVVKNHLEENTSNDRDLLPTRTDNWRVLYVNLLPSLQYCQRETHLILEEQLMTGKNIPSKLKSRKLPPTIFPLKVKEIIGIVKSNAHPTTSSEILYH